MNLADFRTRVKWLLNFNQGQANQDFAGPANDTNFHVDWLLNESGREELRLAKLVYKAPFKQRHALTWAASTSTLDIPEALREGQVIAVMDETALSPGSVVNFSEEYVGVDGIYRYSSEKWGWYPTPSSARTLSVLYLAGWVSLVAEAQVPTVIPQDLHGLLCWSAAILGRRVADQEAPAQWLEQQKSMREQWHLLLSKGHPSIQPPTIVNFNPDVLEPY